LQIKTNIVRCHTADSKPVKQEVNSTVVLPPLVFPELETSLIDIARVIIYDHHMFIVQETGCALPFILNTKTLLTFR
jgi:hypothetical protein